MTKINFLLFAFAVLSLAGQTPDSNFVYIKGGKFVMGCDTCQMDEAPVHKVKISDFYVSKYEVTYEEYCRFLNEKGNQYEGNTMWIDLNGHWRDEKCRIYVKDSIFYVEEGYEKYPVSFVSWWGAERYCEWKGGRLPTEAEWEYLAKTGFTQEQLRDSLQYFAVFRENSGYKPNPVGTKLADKNGLYDLFGNVSEWCYDWYLPEYYFYVKKKKDPKGPDFGDMKVKRGGNWSSTKKVLYPTNRKASNPNSNNITIGFRVVIPVK